MISLRHPDVSVIICTYSEARLDLLCRAIASVRHQTTPAQEIVVVVDHNTPLALSIGSIYSDVVVVENRASRGLSGARNTGVQAACGQVVAFLDDDAAASPQWLEHLLREFAHTGILGVGGSVIPEWIGGRPAWFPIEFQWVVGCSYRGLPDDTAPIRNLCGTNMAIWRSLITQAGGFDDQLGRLGSRPVGCEETELCIRAGNLWPDKHFVYEPLAQVLHHVPAQRTTVRYFLFRCFSEGQSKAVVTRQVGAVAGLSTERTYTLRTLPAGVVRGIIESMACRKWSGVARSGAIVLGLAMTLFGYGAGLLQHRSRAVSTMPHASAPR